MSNKPNLQELYETLRQVRYRGSLTEIAKRTETSHQWVVRVLAGRVNSNNPATIRIIETALVVKSEYEAKLAEHDATLQKVNIALAAAIA